jgi:hypothetical protein
MGNEWKIIYDCVDFFTATAKTKEEKKILIKNERLLVKKARLVTAISKVLQKHLKKYREDVHLVPQGFRIQDFDNPENYISPRIKAKKPIIGFAGAVNYRLDYNLLLPLAQRNSKWSFVIWGPVLEENLLAPKLKSMKDKLLSLPNVSTGFLKDRTKLPGVFSQFDIAMIPYDINQEFNKYCYPMKLFEFFYLGKPVVSTAVEELKRFPNLVKMGNDTKKWEKIINNLLDNPWPQKYKDEQKKLCEENSWENKVKAILAYLPDF